MSKTVGRFLIDRAGGPEAMRWEAGIAAEPGAGELLIRHSAIGVNFIDVYHRSGTYPLTLPSGLGVEGAGTVEGVGLGVEGFAIGDRVAYVGGPPGAYSTQRCISASRAVALPDGISFELAAASIFKGLTVYYLLHRTYAVQPGDTVLLHAAAGGVGLLACRWLKLLGATVVGTVGSEEKASLATANGCDHVIVHGCEDIPARVRNVSGGKGASVVYDSIGRDTFAASLESLRPMGMLVSFGAASGPVPPVEISALGARGSLFLTRPSFANYMATREDIVQGARELFALLLADMLPLPAPTLYGLRDVASAHRDLEARRTTGSLLLTP